MTVKTALVTGAARGIGLAVARRFLAEGWNVALLDINADQLRETMAALAEPAKTFEIICDVSDPPAIAAAVRQAAAHFGRLDALASHRHRCADLAAVLGVAGERKSRPSLT